MNKNLWLFLYETDCTDFTFVIADGYEDAEATFWKEIAEIMDESVEEVKKMVSIIDTHELTDWTSNGKTYDIVLQEAK